MSYRPEKSDRPLGVSVMQATSDGGEPRHSSHWLRVLVEGMPQLVWRSNDFGNWTWSGPQWQVFTGQSQAESQGRGWLQTVHPDDRAAVVAAWDAARPHGMLDMEFRVRKVADGSYVWHRSRSLPVLDESGAIVEWLGTTTDIEDLKRLQQEQASLLADAQRHARALEAEVQERKRAEERLLYSAFHDDLTKLHNRAYFMGRCRAALKEFAEPSGPRVALLTFDLDRFKLINDSLGHGTGDVLLSIVAKRLRGCVRAQDTVSRIGGDEFALLLEDVDEAGLAVCARRILEAMGRPFWFGRRQVLCSCSLGAAWLDGQHRAEDLLRDADLAMYEAKRAGPGQYRMFRPAMRDGALAQLDLQTDLANAVRHGEFELWYQPICNAATKAVTAVEALIRWRHPARGLLVPDAFMAAAEERGLMRDIGRFALLEGTRQLAAWQRALPGTRLMLHVNLSGAELKDPDLVDQVTATLAAAGIEPGLVHLELTEGVFLDQPALASRVLGQLRRLGVRIALDDFGTGYSSLSYLDQYDDIDTIKIDRSFVARMLTHQRTRAVVTAIVRLAQALKLEVVAEGVETGEQLRALMDTGCGLVQGYLLGQAVPAEELAAALARQGG